jgi:pimeloyl-ACP methyl ester carboxylesterase
MHQLAYAMGTEMLDAARSRRQLQVAKERVQQLRDELSPMLGGIQPPVSAKAETVRRRALTKADAEAVSLEVENGIRVPVYLLRPRGQEAVPVVVAVSQSGKERFLANRSKELEELLRAGFAVCLPDVRGTGETASNSELDDPDTGPAMREFDLSRSLLGSRLKDLRAVLAYLRTRTDIDRKRIAVWGDSFAPVNPKNLWLDEIEFEAGPHIQHSADPLGAHLALLAALYEEDVRAVAARGGLAGYLTVLEDAFTYVPMDSIVWGILKSGDIADIAAALAPRPVALSGLVNGRNILVEGAEIEKAFDPAKRAYQSAGAASRLTFGAESKNIAAWLIAALK